MIDTRIAVVGGGIAGLFTATALIEQGIEDFVVLDAAPEPGGVARTIVEDGFSLEPAAGTLLLPNPDLEALLSMLKVEVDAVASSGRWVYVGGRLIEVPTSPKAALAPVMGVGAKLRAATEPFVRTPRPVEDESLQDFLVRRLGRRAGSLLAWLGASGVFAGDPAQLSARSAFPVFPALEAEAGSIVRGAIARKRNAASPRRPRPTSYTPVGGMVALFDAGASLLGERLHRGFEVDSLRNEDGWWVIDGPSRVRAEEVVMATPRHITGALLGGEWERTLSTPGRAEVAVVGLGFSTDAPLPEGFGVLVGPDEDMLVRGVLLESSYAPARTVGGKAFLKVIAGGDGVAPLPGDDTELVNRLVAETSRVLGVEVRPETTMLVRHRRGIPQYRIGHSLWLQTLDHLSSSMPCLHFTGWDYRGVGVGHLAVDARRIASEIAGH